MLFFLVLSALTVCDALIVGGSDGDIESVPWTLSVRDGGIHFCGATLVERRWAVTAAHCVDGRSAGALEVMAGMESQTEDSSLHQSMAVASITVHPDYDYILGYPFDVAVLELTQDVEYNDRVNYMVLARGSSLWNYAPCTLTGWGNAGQGPAGEVTDKLQQGTGNVMTGPQCITAYPEIITLSNDYVCTAGATICLGDDGGPVTCLDEDSSNSPLALVGIMSWSISAGGFCVPDLPSVHTRVSVVQSWIESVTGPLPDELQ